MNIEWKDKLFDFALLDDKNSYDIIVTATKAVFPQLTTANIINAKDNDGQTALMIAAEDNKGDTVGQLLNNQANVVTVDTVG